MIGPKKITPVAATRDLLMATSLGLMIGIGVQIPSRSNLNIGKFVESLVPFRLFVQ
jgi:hypothetical protein